MPDLRRRTGSRVLQLCKTINQFTARKLKIRTIDKADALMCVGFFRSGLPKPSVCPHRGLHALEFILTGRNGLAPRH